MRVCSGASSGRRRKAHDKQGLQGTPPNSEPALGALTILSAPRGACRISMILTPLSRTQRAGARPRRFPYDRMDRRDPRANEFLQHGFHLDDSKPSPENTVQIRDWTGSTGGAWDDATRVLRPEKQPLLAESGRRSDAAHSVCLRPCDGHQEDILATSLARRPRRR